MPSLREVAQSIGVSTATISLVLNDRPMVSDETRALVLQALDKMNYRRRRIGRPRGSRVSEGDTKPAKAGGRRLSVAMFIPDSDPNPNDIIEKSFNPLYYGLFEGISHALQERGHESCLRTYTFSDPVSVFIQRVSRFDGGLIVPNSQMDVDEIHRAMPNLVQVMGLLRPNARVDHVTYENSAVGRLAAEWLHGRGHRRCAVLADHVAPQIGDRSADCAAWLRRLGAEVVMGSPDDYHQPDYYPKLKAVVEGWLASAAKPTGLFVPSDLLAQRVHELLLDLGVEPGKDLEIIGVNNEIPFLAGLSPRPATLDLHARQVGELAVEQLLRRMERPDLPRIALTVAPTIRWNDADET